MFCFKSVAAVVAMRSIRAGRKEKEKEKEEEYKSQTLNCMKPETCLYYAILYRRVIK